MNLIEEVLYNAILIRNTPWDFSQITLSTDALAVLCEIDGEKNLGLIAETLGRSMHEILETINQLGRLKLIRQKQSRLTKHYDISPPVPTESEGKGRDIRRLYRGVSYRGA